MKKTLGIISNILSILLIGPFSICFSVLGFLFFTHMDDFSWSFFSVINVIATVAFIWTLPACVLGIILSVIYRKKGKYKESYLIQLLPLAVAIIGVFLFIIGMFWSNL